VLAKKASVLKTLNQDFTGNVANNKRLEKRYLALVKGRWRYGERRIKKNLNTNARRHGERHVSIDSNGSYAASIVRPVTVSNIASLVEVSLLTGRTHQIRVHLQSEGHPVAGDERYGDKLFNKSLKTHGLKRLFLHAAELHINHPLHQQRMPFKASLPDDLLRTLGSLKLGV
jgi:23S rRNA pseudouridine955/2504/2580 synthase